MTRHMGCLPDPPDTRDLPLSARLGGTVGVPPSATVWDTSCRVKDQRATNSCVGQAVSQALRLGHIRAGTDCPELAARAVYRMALTSDGSTRDDGTWLRSAVRAVTKIGAPPEAACPFSVSGILEPLPLSVVHSGYDRHGARGYYRVASGDTDGIRVALAAGFPVVGGWQVGEAFLGYDGSGLVDVESGPPRGGHALCLHGYDGARFRGVNSWGIYWGRGGHFDATERWVAKATDVWALDVRGSREEAL